MIAIVASLLSLTFVDDPLPLQVMPAPSSLRDAPSLSLKEVGTFSSSSSQVAQEPPELLHRTRFSGLSASKPNIPRISLNNESILNFRSCIDLSLLQAARKKFFVDASSHL